MSVGLPGGFRSTFRSHSPAMNNRLPDHETEADWVKNMEEVEIVNYDPRWPVLFDEEEAGTYERLKRRLAAEHRTDREAFTDAKSAYVESVMRKPMKSRCLFDDTLVVA